MIHFPTLSVSCAHNPSPAQSVKCVELFNFYTDTVVNKHYLEEALTISQC